VIVARGSVRRGPRAGGPSRVPGPFRRRDTGSPYRRRARGAPSTSTLLPPEPRKMSRLEELLREGFRGGCRAGGGWPSERGRTSKATAK
jgi:hypothetical protein